MPNKISRYSTVREWQCRGTFCGCNHICEPHPEIVMAFEIARFGMNVMYSKHGEIYFHFSSGCRCEAHNTNEGGSKNSQHITYGKNDWIAYEIDGKCRAVDGYFYYKHPTRVHLHGRLRIRVNPAIVLRRMYDDRLIKCVILYDNMRIHMDMREGRRLWLDRRGGK